MPAIPRIPRLTVPRAWVRLEELYGQVIGQWSRYTGHVLTNIGGVHQTRKTYDQAGPVYEEVPEAEQRRAMAWIGDQVFTTPEWMIDYDVLTRIQATGVVDRIRGLQTRVLDRVLDPRRMERLVEAEIKLGDQAYTLADMLDDVPRRGVERAGRRAGHRPLPSQPPAGAPGAPGVADDRGARRAPQLLPRLAQHVDVSQSDIRAFVRGQLRDLQREIRAGLNRTGDRATRLHLEDALVRIEDILDPSG